MNVDEIRHYNARAWDKAVERTSRWTMPITPDEIAAASGRSC